MTTVRAFNLATARNEIINTFENSTDAVVMRDTLAEQDHATDTVYYVREES